MGASKKIKKILIDKGLSQAEFAGIVNKDPQQMRNSLCRDSSNYATIEKWLDAIGVDIVFRDRETGRLYE